MFLAICFNIYLSLTSEDLIVCSRWHRQPFSPLLFLSFYEFGVVHFLNSQTHSKSFRASKEWLATRKSSATFLSTHYPICVLLPHLLEDSETAKISEAVAHPHSKTAASTQQRSNVLSPELQSQLW